jgi:hypothetical protein
MAALRKLCYFSDLLIKASMDQNNTIPKFTGGKLRIANLSA